MKVKKLVRWVSWMVLNPSMLLPLVREEGQAVVLIAIFVLIAVCLIGLLMSGAAFTGQIQLPTPTP